MTLVLDVNNSFLRYSTLIICLLIASCGGYKKLAPIRNLSIEPTNQKLSKSGRYKVRKSDTLYAISFKFGLDFQYLANINGIKSPFTIYPGQILKLKKSTKPATRNRPTSSKTKNTAIRARTTTPDKSATKTSAALQQNAKKPKKQVARRHGEGRKDSSFDGKKKVTTWFWPVKNIKAKKVISGKGDQQGVDIQGHLGEPVIASAPGRVVYSGNGLVGYGNLIIIKHSQSYLSAYAHNDKILVKEKSIVKAGQKIATMGKNGTGQVQLHFEIRYQGRPINPLKYLQSSG